MNEILSLVEVVASVALVAAPWIVIGRVMAGGEGATLADLFVVPGDAPGSRAVPEEDSVRWRVELLDGPTGALRPLDASDHRSAGRPHVAFGIESSQCA